MYDPTLQRERRLRIFKYVAVLFVFAVMVLTVLLNRQHHALDRSSSEQISLAEIPLPPPTREPLTTTTPAPPPFQINPLVDSWLGWIASARKAAEGSIVHHHKKGNPSSIYWRVVVVPGNNNNHDQKLSSLSVVAERDYLKKPWDTPRNGVRMLYLTSVGFTKKMKRQYQLLVDYLSEKRDAAHLLSGSSSSSKSDGVAFARSPVAIEKAFWFARKKIASVFGVSRHDFNQYHVTALDAMQSDPITEAKGDIKRLMKQVQAESQKKHADDHAKEADEDNEEDEIVKKGDILGMFIAPLHELYHDPDENTNAKQQDDNVGLIVYFRNADLSFVEPRGKVLKALLKEMKHLGWFKHADVERQRRSSDGQDDQDEKHYSTEKPNPRLSFLIDFLIAK